MEKSWVKKSLVFGVIGLFFGTTILTGINANEEVDINLGDENSPEENLVPLDGLDQSQTISSGTAECASYPQQFAQSFIPTSHSLTRVKLLLFICKNSEPPTPTPHILTVSIKSNLSADNLTSKSLPLIDTIFFLDWVEFDFPDIETTPGKTYYIIYSPQFQNSYLICCWEVGIGDYYVNGTPWEGYQNTNWYEKSNFDFCFKTYGEGAVGNDEPDTPTITGETNGARQTSYNYTIRTTDPEQDDVKYFIDWGDNTNTITDLYKSGKEIIASHTWNTKGTYSVKVKATDEHGAESDWATLTVTMPCSYNKPMHQFLDWLFQRFPNAFPLLRQLMGY